MEFDTSSPAQASGITDEMRAAAAARQATIAPLHADVAPDDQSDDRIVSDHIHATPIANIPIDSESTTAYHYRVRLEYQFDKSEYFDL
jgi:hypothetical protein